MRAGELFVPMHWSAQYASAARMGALVESLTDPVSGQPQSKYVPVSVARLEVGCWMQVVSRAELDPGVAEFWIKTPIAGGFRYLLAFTSIDPAEALAALARTAVMGGAGEDCMRFDDPASGDHRLVRSDGDRVLLMLCAARERSRLPDAGWLDDVLARAAPGWLLLAGRSACEEQKGRLVCSCLEVGEQQIVRAIRGGAASVRDLGEQLRCGTNCGSCIPELKALLAAVARDPAVAAPDAA